MITFLIPEGSETRWHEVASDEIWHYTGGSPFLLFQDASGTPGVSPATTVKTIGPP